MRFSLMRQCNVLHSPQVKRASRCLRLRSDCSCLRLTPALEASVFLFKSPSSEDPHQWPQQQGERTRHLDAHHAFSAAVSSPHLMSRDHAGSSNPAFPREPLAPTECGDGPCRFGQAGELEQSRAPYREWSLTDTADRFDGRRPFRPTLDILRCGPHDVYRRVNVEDAFKLQ